MRPATRTLRSLRAHGIGGRGEALVATLGQEPQVVTIALDLLLQQGRGVRETVVVHTTSSAVLAGLQEIRREFLLSYPSVRLRSVSVRGPAGRLDDFRSEADVRSLLSALYRAVRDAKRAYDVVHLSLAGGRKVMSVAAMVVAQLLFGPEDRVWHLLDEAPRPEPRGLRCGSPLSPDALLRTECIWIRNSPGPSCTP